MNDNQVSDNVIDWEMKCMDYKIVQLNIGNCTITEAPTVIKQAFSREDYDIVGGYFKLLRIYETGGLSFDLKLRLSKSPEAIRLNEAFFGMENCENISDYIFGACPRSHLAYDILLSFNQE